MKKDPVGETQPVFPARLIEAAPDVAKPAQGGEQITLAVHKAWKTAGGVLAGKPRHSDRFLTDELKAAGHAVKSLTPKLKGQTRIKPEDARILLSHFFSNWPVRDEDADEDDDLSYGPLLTDDEADKVIDLIVERLKDAPAQPAAKPTASSAEPAGDLPGAPVGDLVAEMFEESDAYFIVGTERPLVTQSPKTELIGFRNIINRLKDIEESDDRERLIVWILDLGRQTFEDLESRQRYLNVQALITRFKALRLFQDRGREDRWKWLERRAAFVILDTINEQPLDMKGIRRPSFLAHHVALSAVAPEWAKSPNFRTLYGSELDRLDQRSFSVFYKAEGWPPSTSEDEDETLMLRRYFGYASFGEVARGLELPSPGTSYEEAYRTVYTATVEMLKMKNKFGDNALTGSQAIAQLRYLGFRLMNLQEFMSL
jgi:hypothetical protein